MFYDLDDPNLFVSYIKETLDKDGIFIIQLSYLPLMIKNLNFYDICNEHLEYYSLRTLNFLMNKHGLDIYDSVENNVNGGSILVSISHTGIKEKTQRFNELLNYENTLNLYDIKTYQHFSNEITNLKNKVIDYIERNIKESKQIIGLGASTKGNMLLQLFGINKKMLPYISEKNPEKVGLRTLGTDIELISEDSARKMKPSCMLVLPWYFKEEIIDRERNFINEGGVLLFPMPYVHIVEMSGEQRL